MNKFVVKTNDVSKKYKNTLALDGVSMSIKKGEIYGLIGRNGAGKTTLMKLITNLHNITNGSIEVFGCDIETQRGKISSRIGTLIELSGAYPDLTAYENMEITRRYKGIAGKECIDEKLKLVGLGDVGKKKVKNFSLGMKQRLGLAMALLGEPEFLVLDEPTNGLDPVAVVEIREVLKKLNRDLGITILISSHMLTELTHIVDKYGIIKEGKLVKEIYAENINTELQTYLEISVGDISKAVIVLEERLNIKDYKVLQDNKIIVSGYTKESNILIKELVKGDVDVFEVRISGDNVEEYFTRLMS